MHDLVRNRGSTIRGGRTNIEVLLEYNPPGGKAGELVAELVKDPDKQVRRAVDGFRQGGGARRPRRRLTGSPERAAPARVGATVLRNPVTKRSQIADEVMVGRHEHSILWSC
jgi:hypothetical protein